MYGNCMVWVKDYVIYKSYKIHRKQLNDRLWALRNLSYEIYPTPLTIRDYKSGLRQVKKNPYDRYQLVEGDYFLQIDGGFFHGMPCIEVYPRYNKRRNKE